MLVAGADKLVGECVPIHELRVLSVLTKPTEHHRGWVEVLFKDVHGTYSGHQVSDIVELITDDMLPAELHGFKENHGIFDYHEKYAGIDFVFVVPQCIKDVMHQAHIDAGYAAVSSVFKS